jgi:hypothetical protein
VRKEAGKPGLEDLLDPYPYLASMWIQIRAGLVGREILQFAELLCRMEGYPRYKQGYPF